MALESICQFSNRKLKTSNPKLNNLAGGADYMDFTRRRKDRAFTGIISDRGAMANANASSTNIFFIRLLLVPDLSDIG
jgi:hypothetical protein